MVAHSVVRVRGLGILDGAAGQKIDASNTTSQTHQYSMPFKRVAVPSGDISPAPIVKPTGRLTFNGADPSPDPLPTEYPGRHVER